MTSAIWPKQSDNQHWHREKEKRSQSTHEKQSIDEESNLPTKDDGAAPKTTALH